MQDAEGRVAYAEGPVPEAARNVPLTQEKVAGQLTRTGGTPYVCEKALVKVEEGLSLPLSALNNLRRQALEELSNLRMTPPQRRKEEFHPGVRYQNPKEAPLVTVSVQDVNQITPELLALKPALLYIPADQGAAHPEVVERCRAAGVPVAVNLPRICSDTERQALESDLNTLHKLGVEETLAGTLGVAKQAMELGFRVRGDYGLGVYNSQTVKDLKRLGFTGLTASFELKLAQIRDLSKPIPMEMIGYGRLPLMITENCIVHNHSGQHTCGKDNRLVDRKGEHFPVVKAWGCRNEILNAKKLFLADKAADYSRLGLWAVRLQFTTEDAAECVRVLERYLGRGNYVPSDHTRGLYYRDVE